MNFQKKEREQPNWKKTWKDIKKLKWKRNWRQFFWLLFIHPYWKRVNNDFPRFCLQKFLFLFFLNGLFEIIICCFDLSTLIEWANAFLTPRLVIPRFLSNLLAATRNCAVFIYIYIYEIFIGWFSWIYADKVGDLLYAIIHFGFSIKRTIFSDVLSFISISLLNIFDFIWKTSSENFQKSVRKGAIRTFFEMNNLSLEYTVQNEHIAMDMNNFDAINRKKNRLGRKLKYLHVAKSLSMLVFSCFALNQSAYYHKSPDKLTKRLNKAEKSKNVLFGVMWENRGRLDQKQRFIFIVQVVFYPLKWNWIVLFKLFQISLSDELRKCFSVMFLHWYS